MVKRNIIISKAGGNSSGVNYKISLPAKMVKALGITPEDREVCVYFEREPFMCSPRIVITRELED